jgi:hypothetical protein
MIELDPDDPPLAAPAPALPVKVVVKVPQEPTPQEIAEAFPEEGAVHVPAAHGRNGAGDAANTYEELALVSCCLSDLEGLHWPMARHLPVEAFRDPEARACWRAMQEGAVYRGSEGAFAAAAGLGLDRLSRLRDMAGIGLSFTSFLRTVGDRWRTEEYRRIAHQMATRPDIEPGVLAAKLLALQPPGKETNSYTVWQPAAFREWQAPVNINVMGGGYLRKRQLTTLIGPPGVGKSRLSLWMGVSHICSRRFFGLDMQNGPAKWLYFGNENDPLRQKTDLEWFYRNLTAPEQALVDQNLFLHVIDQPADGIITLADPEAFQRLNATLKKIQPDVVVFDPWGNMIEGNENDNEEVRRTLKALLRAVSANCPDAAILVIHHARTGKSTAIEAGNNYSGGSLGRGSKALVSAARCELALWPGHSEDSSRLVLTCEKVNNVEKFEAKGIIFDNGAYREDPDFSVESWRDDIEGVRGGKTLTIREVVEAVRSGKMRSKDISDALMEEYGVARSTVMLRLKDACEKGYLVKTQPAGSYTLGGKQISG